MNNSEVKSPQLHLLVSQMTTDGILFMLLVVLSWTQYHSMLFQQEDISHCTGSLLLFHYKYSACRSLSDISVVENVIPSSTFVGVSQALGGFWDLTSDINNL